MQSPQKGFWWCTALKGFKHRHSAAKLTSKNFLADALPAVACAGSPVSFKNNYYAHVPKHCTCLRRQRGSAATLVQFVCSVAWRASAAAVAYTACCPCKHKPGSTAAQQFPKRPLRGSFWPLAACPGVGAFSNLPQGFDPTAKSQAPTQQQSPNRCSLPHGGHLSRDPARVWTPCAGRGSCPLTMACLLRSAAQQADKTAITRAHSSEKTTLHIIPRDNPIKLEDQDQIKSGAAATHSMYM